MDDSRNHGGPAPAGRGEDSSIQPLPPRAIAIIAFAGDLARRKQVMDQKTMARLLGMGESTLVRYIKGYPEVESAVAQVLPLSAARRVELALDELTGERAVITQALLAERAGVGANTVSRIKSEDPALAKRIDFAVETSLRAKVEALIGDQTARGLPVTQKWLAEALGMSESAVVYQKNHDPLLAGLLEKAKPPSAADKVRMAIEDLQAVKLPTTAARIVEKSGVHQGTVSRLKQKDPALAAGVVSAQRQPEQMTREEVDQALAARIQIYGDERCNTASALGRSREEGGDNALLSACKRLGIELPPARKQELNSLVSYLNRMAATRPLSEEEAVALWRDANSGDREAAEELLVRARPLARIVIEDLLNAKIDPGDFRSNLIEHMISEGDFIITGGWQKWNGSETLVKYLGRILREGLSESNRSYYYRRKMEERLLFPLDAAGSDGDSSVMQGREQNVPPDVNAAILNDAFPFNEDELVIRRDLSSGVSVILPLNKQVMAAALGEVFHLRDISSVFRSGVGSDWAVFMCGSTGRLGTAILGECAAHLVILTDASDVFTRKSMSMLSGLLGGRIIARGEMLPAITVGKGRDFDGIMNRVNSGGEQHRVLRQFVSVLRSFGVGLSFSKGIAVIDAAAVGMNEVNPAALTDTELYFQTARNGIRVAGSREGAHDALIKKLMVRMRRDGKSDPSSSLTLAGEVLEVEVAFLESQKALLEQSLTSVRKETE